MDGLISDTDQLGAPDLKQNEICFVSDNNVKTLKLDQHMEPALRRGSCGLKDREAVDQKVGGSIPWKIVGGESERTALSLHQYPHD